MIQGSCIYQRHSMQSVHLGLCMCMWSALLRTLVGSLCSWAVGVCVSLFALLCMCFVNGSLSLQ